jgi:hypothetical protein
LRVSADGSAGDHQFELRMDKPASLTFMVSQ